MRQTRNAAVLGSSPLLRFASRSPRFQILGHCCDKQLSPVSKDFFFIELIFLSFVYIYLSGVRVN